MKENPNPTPEEEIVQAKKALADGKFKRAAYHVTGALEADPGRRDWVDLLDRIIAAAPDPLQLVAADNEAAPADLAVRAHILARQGKVAKAVERLLTVVSAHPEATAYLCWTTDWLDQDEAAGALDMKQVNSFLTCCLQRYPGLVVEGDKERAFLKRLLPFVKKIDATQVTDEMFLATHVGILRKLGRLDEALATGNQAFSNQPGYHTAIALAQAHEARGEKDQCQSLYQEALRFKPDDVPARLDLGDQMWSVGKLDDAERLYKEALQRDPQNAHARPSYFAVRYAMNKDEGWKTKLIEYHHANPANDRARDLAYRLAPYQSALPAPTETTITRLRSLTQKYAEQPPKKSGRSVEIVLSWLESPSARLACELQMKAMKLDMSFEFAIENLQTPDPRKPRCPVDYLLWKYKGNTPAPAVREPSAEAARVVAELAAHPYDLKDWSKRATELGPRLGLVKVEDLLGVMVHPPLPPEGRPAWTWLQHVQVAAALVLAHSESAWKNSVRRKALFALANGPLDWTVGAAIIALTSLALENAEARNDITKLFVELMKAIPQQGHAPYAHALVCCFLQFPNLSDKERNTLRDWQRDLESA